MNQGVVQSSPVQQMVAAGGPNWWSINNMRPPPQHQQRPFLGAPPPHHQLPPSALFAAASSWNQSQELRESWSQLLLGGLVSDEDKPGLIGHIQEKRMESWEQQLLNQSSSTNCVVHVKQENSSSSYTDYAKQAAKVATNCNWSHHNHQISSPKSCVTNMLDFSPNSSDGKHAHQDLSSECNSTATGGANKKARIQPSSAQSTFKVRKEKLGDRITALHQLVSPFGKTDTASVLLEAIGYIRFLQNQIEALSLPYLASGFGTNMRQHRPVRGERNCLFPEDPGQLLTENCIKRKGVSDMENHERKMELRSRGLCLVPVSCTLHVGSENGADYWAPAFGANFQ